MGADFDRQSMDHLMDVLSEGDRGLLIMLGYILELRRLSPRRATDLVADLEGRVKELAETGLPREGQAEPQTD